MEKKRIVRGINMDTAFRNVRATLKEFLEMRRSVASFDRRGVAARLREMDAFHAQRRVGGTGGVVRLHKHAVKILGKAVGPKDTRVASFLHELGAYCAMNTNRRAEAARCHERAAAIMELHFGPDSPCVAEFLAHAAACRA
jgi:hypothetical protein